MKLHPQAEKTCRSAPNSYRDLKALFINTTLKKSPDHSQTEDLMTTSRTIMERNGIQTQLLRVADYDIALGIYPDMTEHGWDRDDWPKIQEKIMAAEILVVGTPIWLGEESSLCRVVIERLYSYSGKLNDSGQYAYYGRTGGALITGNEDGVKHSAMTILYALQHIGFTILPQADAGWIGEAGPGPSYGDDGAGYDNEFTQRNTTFMTWNLMHMARLLKDAGGIPAHGNQRSESDAGCRFDHPNPEHR